MPSTPTTENKCNLPDYCQLDEYWFEDLEYWLDELEYSKSKKEGDED